MVLFSIYLFCLILVIDGMPIIERGVSSLNLERMTMDANRSSSKVMMVLNFVLIVGFINLIAFLIYSGFTYAWYIPVLVFPALLLIFNAFLLIFKDSLYRYPIVMTAFVGLPPFAVPVLGVLLWFV